MHKRELKPLDLKKQKQYQEACYILETLNRGFASRLAGGCVRDRLLNIQPKDFDIATAANPDEVAAFLNRKALRLYQLESTMEQ